MNFACFAIPPSAHQEADFFWAIWRTMARSVRRLHANSARILLLTSRNAVIPSDVDRDHDLRLTSIEEHSRLMTAELECWCQFTRHELFDQPTILIDPDLLVQRNLFDAFNEKFDVGLTWRIEPGIPHPINAGVILLDPTRRERVTDFFTALVERLQVLPPKFHQWYGDQEALTDLVGPELFQRGTPPRRIKVGRTTVRLFSADTFNYSAPYGSEHAHAPDAHIVHFKGKRKHAMAGYARDYLESA